MGQIPPAPRERDFDQSESGAKDYARELVEWLRIYVDGRNEDRQDAIDQLAQVVRDNTADLMRGKIRPGWVEVQFALLRIDIKALLDDNKSIRRHQRTVTAAAISATMSLIGVLVLEVVKLKGAVG